MKKILPIILLAALLLSFGTICAQAGSLSISNQVTFSKGKTTVTWTDSGSNGPYQVAYRYYDGGSAGQSGFWAGGSKSDATTYSKSYTFSELIPGCRYIITVFDSDNNMATETIQVPEAKAFNDTGIRASTMTSVSQSAT